MIAQGTLFHFTSEQATLLQILEEMRLRASYNVENISDYYPNQRLAGIPMICFCDGPLKFASEHPMRYGGFGIGLKKSWGLKNGVNPILYRCENSPISACLSTLIKIIARRTLVLESGAFKTSQEVVFLTSAQDEILQLSAFSKQYKTGDVLNYLDREWRFVPESVEIPLLKQSDQLQKLNENYFRRTTDYLPFTTLDIRYLICPDNVPRRISSISYRSCPINKKMILCRSSLT